MPVPQLKYQPTSLGTANHTTLSAFYGLVLNTVGPFPKALGGFKFLRMAIDNSMKWIEPEPVREITATTTIKVHASASSTTW